MDPIRQDAPTERVEIVLQDVATTSPWRRLATTLGGTQGTRFLRFVARARDDGSGPDGPGTVGEERASGSFPVLPLQHVEALDLDEAWGADVRARFDELQARLLEDGWRPVDRGDQWWSVVFERRVGTRGPGAEVHAAG